jgi:EAL domain-containing protein (putative c-di-GMP-specific phosphodiesterase class I)
VELSFSRLATLSRCIREGGLEAFFQPVVSLSDGRRAWYETLLRVRGEGGRLEPPLVYLELARSTGYWDAITDFIVSRALDRLRSGCGSVSINIGTEDIGREAFRRAAAEAAALARERGCDFILELLETDSSDLSEEHFAVLRELRAAGCLIAIDDFGMGYSNYSRLLSFPVDIVKFDMSLARRAFGEPAVEELLAGLVKFCSGLGIITVVEGLESEEEVRRFREMGLDFGQGYFWSPAVPSHEAPPSPPGRISPRSP